MSSKFNISIYKLISRYVSLMAFLLAFLFSVFCFLFNPPSVHASPQGLSISPIIINVPLSPGKVYNYEITIENLTDSPLPLKTNLNDFQTTGEEGGYIFEDSKSNPLLSWIKLSNTDFILEADQKKTILLTITTPNTVPLGGYYGMLFFEPVLQTTDANSSRVASKIGVLLLANIGVGDKNAKKAEVPTFTTGFFHQESKIPILLRVKNISLHYFTAKPILTVSPLLSFSKADQKPIYLEEKIVFQGKIRRWEQMIDLPDLKPNIYKAHMAVSSGNGEHIDADRYFVILPFGKPILVILSVVIVLFLIRKRKRLKKAFRALLTA